MRSRIVAARKSAGDAFAETSRDRREIAVEQLHALLDRRLERLGGDCRRRREPAGQDFQAIFAHRNRRVYRCEQHLVKHGGIAGHHAVEDVLASALSAQCHPVEDRSYCQERGRRDASCLVVKNEKAAEAVRQDFGLAVLVQDHCIMAQRLVARCGSSTAVAIKGGRRRLADHIFVDQRAARADKITIGKLPERRLAGLPFGINRQQKIFALQQTRSGHPHSGKCRERGGLCRRAVLARSAM